MRLVWEDDFDGPSLNSSRWNVLEQAHRGGVYTRANVGLEGGHLVLRTEAQNLTVGGRSYYVTSGAVNTSGLAEQRTGRWEARVKLPLVAASAGYTLHSSLWLFSNVANPRHSGCAQEIDVLEQYAAGPQRLDTTPKTDLEIRVGFGSRVGVGLGLGFGFGFGFASFTHRGVAVAAEKRRAEETCPGSP